MKQLKGRVAVVTGAAMGMGREIALRLNIEGCSLALCDIDMTALLEVKHACEAAGSARSSKITVHQVDVSDRSQVKSFVADVVSEHGEHVHLLFNNAGIHRPQPFDRMSEASFDKIMAVNVNGVVDLTRAFWPYMLQAEEAAVVNTSSVAGFFPPSGSLCSPYVTSKYAVRGFSEALAMECKLIAPHISVHVVHPGAIATEIVGKAFIYQVDSRALNKRFARLDASRLNAMSDEEKQSIVQAETETLFKKYGYSSKAAADMIVDGVRAGKLRILVGWDAVIMDWWVRAFPTLYWYDAGAALVFISSVIGRHFYGPLAIVTLLASFLRFRRFLPRSRL
eukprot:TRINITY_DN58827_c0_g1_i1.p1 TRINITY_DN58827_c0_g1~~TRINITY_DN58827_c0_g1_i1.p1  ORF type:complete len:337 (-),score=44.48 TRINITY_DN58827_c0_g1_i1:84-1094(-)